MRLNISMSLQNMTLPLTVLAGLSVVGGFLGIPGASAISNFWRQSSANMVILKFLGQRLAYTIVHGCLT